MSAAIRTSALAAAILALASMPAIAQASNISCGSQAAAVNEYCETLPGAGGPHGTLGGGGGAGSAPLAVVLPRRIVRATASSAARRPLLDLPAPYPRTSLAAGSTAGVGTGSLLEPVLLVLAAVVTLGAVAVLSRRRSPAGSATADAG